MRINYSIDKMILRFKLVRIDKIKSFIDYCKSPEATEVVKWYPSKNTYKTYKFNVVLKIQGYNVIVQVNDDKFHSLVKVQYNPNLVEFSNYFIEYNPLFELLYGHDKRLITMTRCDIACDIDNVSENSLYIYRHTRQQCVTYRDHFNRLLGSPKSDFRWNIYNKSRWSNLVLERNNDKLKDTRIIKRMMDNIHYLNHCKEYSETKTIRFELELNSIKLIKLDYDYFINQFKTPIIFYITKLSKGLNRNKLLNKINLNEIDNFETGKRSRYLNLLKKYHNQIQFNNLEMYRVLEGILNNLLINT